MNLINLDFYLKLIKIRFHWTTQEFSTIGKHLPQHTRTHVEHYRAHRHQMRLQVGKRINLKNFDFYAKVMKKWITFNNSRSMHHLETFTSASALSHSRFWSAPSLDEVTICKIDELDKPWLLRKSNKIRILLINLRAQHHYKLFASASAFPHATLPSAPSSDEVTSSEMD